ncbi:PLP-dependent aminotransferase family protein [Dictyobacter halimunensis]
MDNNTLRASLLSPMLDPASGVALYRQLYEAMRQAILQGTLSAGTKLPSTRTLAQTLGISRTTVIQAFDQLLAEGYIYGKAGSGTYVAQVLPDELLRLPAGQAHKDEVETVSPPSSPLSQRGKMIAASAVAPVQKWDQIIQHQAFRHGIPALHEFPFKLWSQLATRRWKHIEPACFGYSNPAGYRPLRQEIARYLQAARGVHCTEEQIVIMAGSQQALHLAVQLLIDPGDEVWIEDPCYMGARGALLSGGARLVSVPVDDEGLNVAQGIVSSPRARMAYVTPSHQFPVGAVMSLSRRLALLRWASQSTSWILEDDYDSEYRYTGHPLASLQGLDQAGRVIYIGTFSKVLFPALRLGYLVSPPELIDAFRAARAAADRHAHMLDQMVLTDFMAQEHFARHLRRMRSLYEERQAILLEAILKELGDILSVKAASAGMNLLAHLPSYLQDTTVAQQAAGSGVSVTPISKYYIQHPPLNALLLGYAAYSQQEIYQGIHRLARVLR